MFTEKQIDRFWSNVDIQEDDDCWVWKKCTHWGYGYVRLLAPGEEKSKAWRVHRLAWLLTNGEIPEDLYVLHHCDNKPCCNPKHLFLGTQQDNISDCIAKGRNCTGEDVPSAVLTENQVRKIKFSMRHMIGKDIIEKLGLKCTISQVNRIKRGGSWKHIRPRMPANSLLTVMMQTQGSC